MQTSKQTNEERIIELLERSLIVELYLKGASRDQIRSVVGVGTDKAAKIISLVKDLKKGISNA